MTSAAPQHPCPACGFLVFSAPPGSKATCAVCGWVDDFEQLVHPDFTFGANSGRSLREAQSRALAKFPLGALAGEHTRDPRWRPLRAGEVPRSEVASPVCYIGTPERDDFEPYWVVAPRP